MSDEKSFDVINLTAESMNAPIEGGFDAGNYIYYGDNDDYPDTLARLYQNDALHSSLIKSISQMISGVGMYSNAYQGEIDDVLKIRSRTGDELNKIMRLAAFDLKKDGYCYIEVIKRWWGLELNVLPTIFVRNGRHKEGRSPHYFLYSSKRQFSAGVPLPAFDGQKQHSILMIKQDDTLMQSYAQPDYVGCINDVLLSISAREHKLNSVQNGFFPSAIINFNRPVSDIKVRAAEEAAFRNTFAGPAGRKIVFSWNPSKEMETTLDTFEPPNIVEFFKDLTPEVQQAILVGHRVTSPLLFGVRLETSSGLGSNTEEIQTAYSIMNETVIKPFQIVLIEAFNKLVKFGCGQDLDLAIKPFKPSILEHGEKPADVKEEVTKFSSDLRRVIPVALIDSMIEKLKSCGVKQADLEAEGWEEMSAEEVKFAIESEPSKPSALDSDQYRVRFRYVGPRDDRNRTFCAKVLDLDLIYRKEDIDAMSLRGENQQFGVYDIFTLKGNINCRHRWEQVVFKKVKDKEEAKKLVTLPKVLGWLKSFGYNKLFKNAI